MFAYGLLVMLPAFAKAQGNVVQACDVRQTNVQVAPNLNRCVRITVAREVQVHSDLIGITCGQYTAQPGISVVKGAINTCRRFNAKGVFVPPTTNKLAVFKMKVGETLECHCSPPTCGVVYLPGILGALDGSSHSVLSDEIKCIKRDVSNRLSPSPTRAPLPPYTTAPRLPIPTWAPQPHTLRPPFSTLVPPVRTIFPVTPWRPQTPPKPPVRPPPQTPSRPPVRPPPTTPSRPPIRPPLTTPSRPPLTRSTLPTQSLQPIPTSASTKSIGKTKAPEKDQDLPSAPEMTEDELVRRLSLHLVMLSLGMSTLMACQLALLTKLRNLYRNPSQQHSKKKKSKKSKGKSAKSPISTKSPSSSAPSSPTKDYFKL